MDVGPAIPIYGDGGLEVILNHLNEKSSKQSKWLLHLEAQCD